MKYQVCSIAYTRTHTGKSVVSFSRHDPTLTTLRVNRHNDLTSASTARLLRVINSRRYDPRCVVHLFADGFYWLPRRPGYKGD